MGKVCALWFGLAVFLMIGVGCRHDELVGPVTVPIAEEQAAIAELSDEQKAAVQAIVATAGVVESDEAGFPVQIDLASERVFADESLVRAALMFPELKGLCLAVSSVSETTLMELATLTDLEELFLQDATLGDAAMVTVLQAMPDLRRLTLRRLNAVTDESLDAVAECERLEVLALIEMNQVTGAGLDRLAGTPRLRSLDLRNCGRLSSEDFKRLAAIEGLVEVKFGGPAVNDEIASVIAGLLHVRSVAIEDAEISGACIETLAADRRAAERIRTLAFARCYGVTDEALEAIGRFPNLDTLSLRDIMVTGAFLVALSDGGKGPLPLKTLIATNAFLDDGAVQRLPTLAPDLERLDLRGNAGITEESQQAFKKLQGLEDVKLE